MIVDAEMRAEVVQGVTTHLRRYYIFPEVGAELAAAIEARLASGAYRVAETGQALADALTEDLQTIGNDRHLRMAFSEEPQPTQPEEFEQPAWQDRYRQEAELQNYGVQRVERLPGNIGYLDLRQFHDPDLGGPTACAAMNLLAYTAALIVDLRRCRGGAPGMVALISSYLFDPEPVHLNSLYSREDDRTKQYWTLPYVPGRRFGEKPVYVLTSATTFSAAEEFTYNLQNLFRATVVGETTRGGAHPVHHYPINPHFGVRVSIARAINPISGTNWEGTGVTPDVAVPADDALRTAQILALQAVLAALGEQPPGPQDALADEVRTALAELHHTPT